MLPSAALSFESTGCLAPCLSDDLIVILPDYARWFTMFDYPHRQSGLFQQPRTIMRPNDRFLKRRVKPANAPYRLAALKVPSKTLRNRQMLVEPLELGVQLIDDPRQTRVFADSPTGLKKAALNPAIGVDQRRHKTHIHDVRRSVFPLRSLKTAMGKNGNRPPAAYAALGGRLVMRRIAMRNMSNSFGTNNLMSWLAQRDGSLSWPSQKYKQNIGMVQ